MCTVYIRTRFGIILSEWSHLSWFHIAKWEGGGWWRWELSPSQVDDCRIDSSHRAGSHSAVCRTLCIHWRPDVSLQAVSLRNTPPHSVIPTDTQTYTLPLKFVVSLCHPLALRLDFNACRFFWSDSHALWRAVEGWMGAQSAIAFINTNSYARCSQVSISSQCSFSLGVNAHFFHFHFWLRLE